MCGIYGRIGRRDDELDRRATLSLRHRGPDDAGLLVDPGGVGDESVVLGHTRLAILDLSDAGHQPMRAEDESLAITYNGEIYNFRELRDELEGEGVTFRSGTDTEVVLQLYRRHGDAAFARLEGMFALGVWDRRARRLVLARDPSGMKPLFYRDRARMPQHPDSIAFASEIKALLADPRVERRPDVRSLAGFLAYTYVPPPGSAFEGVGRVPPGHLLVWQDGRTHLERFHRYTPLPKLELGSFDEATDALDSLLLEVVRQHMISDVPLGAFLSGGVDSGLMVALMQRVKRERGEREPVRTFTLGFGPEGRRYDETEPARQVARALGVDHQEIPMEADLVERRFHHVALQFDEPFGNPTALLHDALCEATRREVTVALAGDGGDEGFGGYPRHRAACSLDLYQRAVPASLRRSVVRRLADRIPEWAEGPQALRRARRFLRTAEQSVPAVYRDWLTYHSPDELSALLSEAAFAACTADGGSLGDLGETESTLLEVDDGSVHPLDLACLADVYGFMPNNVLRDSDHSSMRVALEVRAPYADRRVVDFGLRLPPAWKVGGPLAALVPGGRSSSKRLLRAVAARYLPGEVHAAPKQGFVAPMGTWLNGPLRPLLDRATRPEVLESRGLVRPEAVKQMVEEHRQGRRDRTWHLWELVMLESWFEHRVDRLELPEVREPLPATVWPPAA